MTTAFIPPVFLIRQSYPEYWAAMVIVALMRLWGWNVAIASPVDATTPPSRS